MSQSLEDLLCETLRGYAADSRDVPGMSARATRRGQQVRRRRRAVVAATSGLLVVVLGSALLPRAVSDRAAPPARESAPVVTPGPETAEEAAMSAAELETWVKGLPEGPPTELTHELDPGLVVVQNRVIFTAPGGAILLRPMSTAVGTLATLLEDGAKGSYTTAVVLIRGDGSMQRLGGRDVEHYSIAPDGRTAAVAVDVPSRGGTAQVQVVDVVSGRVLHSVSRDLTGSGGTVGMAGWAGHRVIWSEDVDQQTVWSWVPGQRPEKVTEGALALAAAGDFLALLPDDEAQNDVDEACPRLVRLDRPPAPVSPHCLPLMGAISPDAKYFLTELGSAVDTESGQVVSTHPPMEADRWEIVGWEKDAFVLYVGVGDEAPRDVLLVRCALRGGQCERVSSPNVPKQVVRFK